jgi:hypothetical protein
MIYNSSITDGARKIYNPVISGGGDGGGGSGGGACELSLLDSANYNSMSIIEEKYGDPLARGAYDSIPGYNTNTPSSNYQQYIELYNIVDALLKKSQDVRMQLLLKLARETLQGAINAYTVYGINTYLRYDIANLNATIEQLKSGVNKEVVATASGQFSAKQTFRLSAVFRCYILIYGIPEPGVGFDPVKINFLVTALTENGINPYA